MARKIKYVVDENGFKICSQCGVNKHETEYYKSISGNLFAECKECNKERMKERYAKNPDHVYKINRKWIEKMSKEEQKEYNRKNYETYKNKKSKKSLENLD